MTTRREILVAGAGLAGLTAAGELTRRGRDVLVVEKLDEVGGLCRSLRRGPFAFDLTGHVLHLRTDEVRTLVMELLPDSWVEVERDARIHFQGTLVPYPFQVNLEPLPIAVKKECLLGFWEAGRKAAPDPQSCTFGDWLRGTFGEGIVKHFLEPYNRKMWGVDLDEMSAEWTTWSVPVPSLEEVVEGALGASSRTFGYNPRFLYPKEGGIEALPRALAARLSGAELRMETELEELDLDERRARLSTGDEIHFEHLVSTLPLPALLDRVRNLPENLRAARRGLRHVSVVVFNLGVAGAAPLAAHWVYYADPSLPFYRIGFPSNFSSGVGPAGSYSMYVELSLSTLPEDPGALRSAVMAGLHEVGALSSEEAIEEEAVVTIPHGYVIYDFHRRREAPRLLSWLKERRVHSTGRYGAWEYGSMETAIAQGLRTAEALS